MREFSLSEVTDFLESATINATNDYGYFIVHAGKDECGMPFVLVNDALGQSTLTVATM